MTNEYRQWKSLARTYNLPRYKRPYPLYESKLIMTKAEIEAKMTKQAQTNNKITK